MKRLIPMLAAAMGASMAAATFTPAAAAPLWPAPAVEKAGQDMNVIRVRSGHPYFTPNDGPDWHGYRGSRRYHPGWRRHGALWFPPAAFAFGLTFGHAMHYPRRHYMPRRHVIWCDSRYRTYRHWDNTYVPRVGYRATCRSPFWP